MRFGCLCRHDYREGEAKAKTREEGEPYPILPLKKVCDAWLTARLKALEANLPLHEFDDKIRLRLMLVDWQS